MIQGRKIRASLSENIPMLVSHEDLNQFENGIINWGDQAEAINQLVMSYEFPMHLAEKQTVNKRKFLQDLHEKYANVKFPKYSSEYTRKNTYIPFRDPTKQSKLADSIESPKPSAEPESPKSPIATISSPIAGPSKPSNNNDERDSPESPFEDIVSDSDEDILQIDLEADKTVE